jgi:hypothetical protein
MKKIIKLRTGDTVPEGAKHLYSASENDYDNVRYSYEYGLFMETTYRHVPVITFHYYEVEINEKENN